MNYNKNIEREKSIMKIYYDHLEKLENSDNKEDLKRLNYHLQRRFRNFFKDYHHDLNSRYRKSYDIYLYYLSQENDLEKLDKLFYFFLSLIDINDIILISSLIDSNSKRISDLLES